MPAELRSQAIAKRLQRSNGIHMGLASAVLCISKASLSLSAGAQEAVTIAVRLACEDCEALTKELKLALLREAKVLSLIDE